MTVTGFLLATAGSCSGGGQMSMRKQAWATLLSTSAHSMVARALSRCTASEYLFPSEWLWAHLVAGVVLWIWTWGLLDVQLVSALFWMLHHEMLFSPSLTILRTLVVSLLVLKFMCQTASALKWCWCCNSKRWWSLSKGCYLLEERRLPSRIGRNAGGYSQDLVILWAISISFNITRSKFRLQASQFWMWSGFECWER